jgi:hypothetical protein
MDAGNGKDPKTQKDTGTSELVPELITAEELQKRTAFHIMCLLVFPHKGLTFATTAITLRA